MITTYAYISLAGCVQGSLHIPMIAKGDMSLICPLGSEKFEILVDFSIRHPPTDAAIGEGGVS
jgi:hypothetical protein